jgi:hypothetical protein
MSPDGIRDVIAECDAAIKQPARQLAHMLDTHTCTDPRCKQCARKPGR